MNNKTFFFFLAFVMKKSLVTFVLMFFTVVSKLSMVHTFAITQASADGLCEAGAICEARNDEFDLDKL